MMTNSHLCKATAFSHLSWFPQTPSEPDTSGFVLGCALQHVVNKPVDKSPNADPSALCAINHYYNISYIYELSCNQCKPTHPLYKPIDVIYEYFRNFMKTNHSPRSSFGRRHRSGSLGCYWCSNFKVSPTGVRLSDMKRYVIDTLNIYKCDLNEYIQYNVDECGQICLDGCL